MVASFEIQMGGVHGGRGWGGGAGKSVGRLGCMKIFKSFLFSGGVE